MGPKVGAPKPKVEAPPKTAWAKEAEEKLAAVPAFEGAEVELNEFEGTARITRPDGRATTVHMNADKVIDAIEKADGDEAGSVKGFYITEAGADTQYKAGDILLRSDASHNTVNHEVSHWLVDQGVITQEEVLSY